jgi:hypothetical protein
MLIIATGRAELHAGILDRTYEKYVLQTAYILIKN